MQIAHFMGVGEARAKPVFQIEQDSQALKTRATTAHILLNG
jgi:hypothetical protein